MAKKSALKKVPVLLMFLYTMLSCGIYLGVWLLTRREGINALGAKPGKEISIELAWAGVAALFATLALSVAAAFLQGSPEEYSPMFWADIASRVTNLVYLVSLLIYAFKAKAIFEAKLVKKELSGLMTFFFNVFYLQYWINKQGSKK